MRLYDMLEIWLHDTNSSSLLLFLLLFIISIIIIVFYGDYTLWVKKHATLHSFITLANVEGDFKNTFTAELSKKFATLLINNNSHRTLNMSLSYLEKCKIAKIAKSWCTQHNNTGLYSQNKQTKALQMNDLSHLQESDIFKVRLKSLLYQQCRKFLAQFSSESIFEIVPDICQTTVNDNSVVLLHSSVMPHQWRFASSHAAHQAYADSVLWRYEIK